TALTLTSSHCRLQPATLQGGDASGARVSRWRAATRRLRLASRCAGAAAMPGADARYRQSALILAEGHLRRRSSPHIESHRSRTATARSVLRSVLAALAARRSTANCAPNDI